MFEHCNCFVVKVTRDCNLRCKYCYIEDKDLYKKEKMSFEVFKTLVQRIIEDKLKTNDCGSFSFIFHGGEPTFIGFDTFKLFLTYAHREFTRYNLNVNFSVQTNGTLLTDDFLTLFRDYSIDVGLSFDGEVQGSNTNRLPSDKTLSQEDLAKRFKNFNLNPGYLTVVTQKNINYVQANINYFLEKLQNHSGKWNYCEDVLNQGDLEISGLQFFNQVALPLFNFYPNYSENNISDTIKNYIKKLFLLSNKEIENNNTQGNCSVKFCGGGRSVLEISPDGQINYCGRYSKDDEVSQCNSLFNQDFLGVISRKKYYEHLIIKDQLLRNMHCDLCIAGDVCDYGCMAFSYVKYGEFKIRTELVCSYFKELKKYLVQHEKELFNKYYEYHKNDKGYIYFNVGKTLNPENLKKLKSQVLPRLGFNFEIEKDPDWTSGDSTCSQIIVYKK